MQCTRRKKQMSEIHWQKSGYVESIQTHMPRGFGFKRMQKGPIPTTSLRRALFSEKNSVVIMGNGNIQATI